MKIVKRLLLGATLALGLSAGAGHAETVLKFGTGIPSAGDQWKHYHLDWVKRVEAAAGGQLKLDLYPDGALGKNGQTFDRVDAGVADIGWDIPLVYGNRFASISVIGDPLAFKDNSKACAALWDVYEQGLLPEFAEYHVIAFTCNPNVNVFLKKPITNPADFSGLKIGVGSKTRGQIVSALGGTPVSVIVPEMYQAISRGVVDGLMTNVAVVQAWKLDESVRFYLNAPFGASVGVVFMKKSTYDGLPAKVKEAIDANSGKKESIVASESTSADEATFLKAALAVSGVSYLEADAAKIEEMKQKTQSIEDEWVKATPNGAKLLAAFKKAYAAN